ncbi:prepilin peptidase [Phycicoccus flavus]|uniref:prepilin peptidase n=1 Tax=Phycicoccus flavus TaxID=2502783 RepID=UPI000FEBF2FD|nr:A24 family peptidase [Phycicoccus flavus]NHA69202.1 prepilin peptidase [Phycicoccus flavus]
MTLWWVALAAALALGLVGHRTGRELATGGYRIEEEVDTPPPGSAWWTGPATGLLAALAVYGVGDQGSWAALPAYLLFAWLTVGLTWIDLDVHRLPIGLVTPTGGALVVLLGVASLATGGTRWLGAVVGALLMGFCYLVLFLLPGGGVGAGDLRLAPVIGALLGWLGLGQVVVGIGAGFLVGGVGAVVLLLGRRVGMKTPIAYGPAMCLGAWVAIAFTSRILTWMLGG